MPAPRLRSTSVRKVAKKLPGGRTTIHFSKRKPKAAVCGSCGAILKGVPRELPFRMKNIPKTKKRPQRPYGGVLCTRCTRKKIVGTVIQ